MFKCFNELSTKYGPLLHVKIGSFSFVLVSSSSLVKEIFKNQDPNFASKPPNRNSDYSLVFTDNGFVFSPYGDYWRFMKKLIVTELFGPRQLERSRHVRCEEITQLIKKVMEKAESNGVVNLKRELVTLSNNVTCRKAMSTRCSGEESEADMCRSLVKESFELANKMSLANLFGPFKVVGQWFLKKQCYDVLRRYNLLMDRLLIEHEEKESKSNGNGHFEDNQDLMDILLKVYHDEHAEFKITMTHLKAFFSDLFFAGTDTSANSMQWVMAELINHPTDFKKVREEIESTVGKTRLVEESDITKLPFLRAVVMETLRLHPGGPIIPRLCREDCKIGGYDIPKGTKVAINIYSIMRDPTVWENASEFWPERFLMFDDNKEQEERKEEFMLRQNFGFVTFGGGRRMCPGVNLALTLISLTVAAMVQCFDWRTIGDEGGENKINMEIKKGMGLSMAHPPLCNAVIHFNPFAV